MNKWQARQKQLRQQVRYLKENDPAAYARLMQRVQEIQAEEEAQQREAQEQLRLAEERERLKRRRVEGAVICSGIPLPAGLLRRSEVDVEGLPLEGGCDEALLAVRSWDVDGYGRLHGVGAGSQYRWEEFNVADQAPNERNTNGFYSVKLDSYGIIFGGINNYIARARCCGLILLSGKVVEHADGVLRAECATIKCIWYTGCAAEVYFDVPMLMKNYPTTPVYVCTQRQVADALIMIVNLMTLGGAR